MSEAVGENAGPKATVTSSPSPTPEPVTAPEDSPVSPGKAINILPELTEILNTRKPAHKALLVAVPGAITSYVEELRALIANGKSPDGDLLSMIIVNKYQELSNASQKLQAELVDLYRVVAGDIRDVISPSLVVPNVYRLVSHMLANDDL